MKKSLLLILVVTIYSQVSAQKPVADFYTDTNIACIGTCINFTDSSTNNPLSWLWDFGDGTTDTVSNPTHCYSITGKFIVTLTVSNDSGTTSKSDTIYMGGASFNVNTVNVACNGGCNGSASVNYANWPPVVSFMWSNGNTGSSINHLGAIQ
jgi:PKD repeat protein